MEVGNGIVEGHASGWRGLGLRDRVEPTEDASDVAGGRGAKAVGGVAAVWKRRPRRRDVTLARKVRRCDPARVSAVLQGKLVDHALADVVVVGLVCPALASLGEAVKGWLDDLHGAERPIGRHAGIAAPAALLAIDRPLRRPPLGEHTRKLVEGDVSGHWKLYPFARRMAPS